MGNPTATVVDGELVLNTAYFQKDLARQVPGLRWNKERGAWIGPASWGSVWGLRAVFGENVDATDELRAWIAREYSDRVKPALELREQLDAEVSGVSDSLFSFQRVGAKFLSIARSALLADEMGLGKSAQAVSAARLIGALPILVVAPNSMKRAWVREFATWWPDLRVGIVEGSVTERRKTIARLVEGELDVIVINWEALRGHTRLAPYGSTALRRCVECGAQSEDVSATSCEVHMRELNEIQFGGVIADEAHRAKDPSSKQTRALWHVAHQQDCFRFALTGTPIANHPGDLWSILHYINPKDWASRSKYVDLYCLIGWNPWGGQDIIDLSPKNRDVFNKVFLPQFIRRTKAAVLPQLPPKVYVTRYVDMSPKQAKAYKGLKAEMIAELENGLVAVTQPLVKMTRLLQLASAYAELTEDNSWILSTPSSKIDDLLEYLEESEGRSTAVFAESRQLIQLAEKALTLKGIPYTSVHGEVTPAERDAAVTRFQNGEVKNILLTVGAGGEGITLTAADSALFMQRSWSMVKNLQAEDRVHRIGQEKPVLIVDQVAPDTIEEYRLEVLAEKDAKLESVVQDEAMLRRLLRLREL